MTAYYNEFDPFAAEWLRTLIHAGHIAPGVVDERPMQEVDSDDLKEFTQCHFFAGIGGWSYALRLAGWPDDRPVWTGSPPCQPFSSAGRRLGKDDERHLAPHFLELVAAVRPPVLFGEQVAAAINKDAWLDDLLDELEREGYATGAAVLPACGVGAPHIRQRLWFVAERVGDTSGKGLQKRIGDRGLQQEEVGAFQGQTFERRGNASRLARSDQQQRNGSWDTGQAGRHEPTDGGTVGGMAEERTWVRPELSVSNIERPCPTNGHWRAADWLFSRDGKWRPVSPFPQPLVDGSAESLGRVCDSRIREIEEEINAATMEAKGERDEILRDLRLSLAAEAKQSWTPGRLPGLHETPFLLAFLRQLTKQGWGISERLPVSGEKASQGSARGVRADNGAARPPCQRGLEGQPTGKHTDLVRILSSILARHTQEAWGIGYQAYAETCFVLADGATARVGRLRGYGNAIVPQVAAEVIAAYMDTKA